MTATACIPITLSAADWRTIWRVLSEQTSEGMLRGSWRVYPIHETALNEIEFRGAEKADPFTCFLCAGDVWLWAVSVPVDIADACRRQVLAYFVEVW